MEIKKIKIGQKIYDVVSESHYHNTDRSLVDAPIAIEMNGTVYPERKLTDGNLPGVYNHGAMIRFVNPRTEEERKELCSDKMINLTNGFMKDMIESSKKLKEQEREILTSPDNITRFPSSENDEPEMAALKEAINAKEIDISKYEVKFKSNYNNDIRLLSKNKISIAKMKTIADNLDMKLTLQIQDKSQDVPNPMGIVVTKELITGEEN